MKQTAVEWLVWQLNQIIDDIPLDKWDAISVIVKRAKQMESEQRKELSDEEIEEIAEREYPIKKDMDRDLWSENHAFKKGMKAYREQLKQRQ